MTTATSPWQVNSGNNDGGGGNFEIPDAGPHAAVLVAMLDLGTHTDSYQGEDKELRKVFFVWELVDAPMSGTKGQNLCIGKEFTLSFGKLANLRKLIEGWSGKAFGDNENFDLTQLCGKKCIATVVHKTSANGERTYAKLENVSTPMKGQEIPDSVIEPFMWSVDDGTPVPDGLWMPRIFGETIADKVTRSREWRGQRGGSTPQQEASSGFDTPSESTGDSMPF